MPMNNPESIVSKSIVVNAPLAHTFKVFTQDFDRWWPRTHHVGKADMKEAVLEPCEGGRWYERGVDGSECEWGRVLVFAPPHRLVIAWHLSGQYAYDPDSAKASRVEVTFHEEGAGRTRVELVHSELDRHGADWPKLKESVGSPGGWTGLLERFAATAAA
jgi:uncharacterized protein YndB with AHSA1/START domain